MFTGIIQGLGQIANLATQGQEIRLLINTLFELENVKIGESIAVNGVCLTVEKGTKNSFSAYASSETMNRTNLSALHKASKVNLERALALGDRFGGHIVSGHIDCIAIIESINNVGQSKHIRLSFSSMHAAEIIPKGSITLDGISLTINDCGADFLEVNIIPETWRATNIETWSVGYKVNMETDIIGKYVRRMLGPYGKIAFDKSENKLVASDKINENFLKQHGFF